MSQRDERTGKGVRVVTTFQDRQADAVEGAIEALRAFAEVSKLLMLPFEGASLTVMPDYRLDVHPTAIFDVNSDLAWYTIIVHLRRTESGLKAIAVGVSADIQNKMESCVLKATSDGFWPVRMDEQLASTIPAEERPAYLKAWFTSQGLGKWYRAA